MKKYTSPALTIEEMSIEDVINVDYSVDGNGQEISWSQIWTSAIANNYLNKNPKYFGTWDFFRIQDSGFRGCFINNHFAGLFSMYSHFSL